MKRLMSFAAIAALMVFSSNGRAEQALSAEALQSIQLQSLMMVSPLDLINWKIGDHMEYDVSLGFFGKGTSTKDITAEETLADGGKGVWMKQVITIMNQAQTVEALIDRATAKIVKLKQNGQDAQIPDEPIEVISQDYTEITVPAGTFKAMHIVAKTKSVSKMEVWANPKETVIDGSLKEIAATQFGIDITQELRSWKAGQ